MKHIGLGKISYITVVIIIISLWQMLIGDSAYIYLDSTKQVIQGFGAANILPWRSDMTDEEIEKAFGTGEGQLGFTILRIRVPNDEDQFSMNVRTAKAAYERGVKIIASPWSPPAYMKSNNNVVGGRLLDEYYDDFAEYLKSFAEYMAENGAPLYAISIQNEPDIKVGYESCDWTASDMVKFLRENASIIRSEGVKIMAPESYQFRREMSDPILNDSLACANLDIVAGHIYGAGLEPYPLAESKGKEVWMTEHLILETSWPYALSTANDINDCMRAGMSAYVWWYIVRFYGPISDGESGGYAKGEVTKRGYVMSQFSRFIRPGYRRVYSTYIPQRDVFVTSYKGDSINNKIIIVAINSGSEDKQQDFIIKDGIVSKFTPFTTSSGKNCERGEDIMVTDSTFSITLPASSITTFVSDEIKDGIVENKNVLNEFHLFQNYPNPFNSVTKIRYSILDKCYVKLKLYNLLGKEVCTLFEGLSNSGTYEVILDGSSLESGVYIYTMEVNGKKVSKKLLLIK